MVLVLLPPSEPKHPGGDGPPLGPGTLSFPELDPLRKELLDELVELAADVAACRAALGLSPRQDEEGARNAALWTSPDAAGAAPLHRRALRRPRRRLAAGRRGGPGAVPTG